MMQYIPDEMIHLKRWICWRWVTDSNGNRHKEPFQAIQSRDRTKGKHASTQDAKQWVTYADASAAAALFDYDGIGFVICGDMVLIDLDNCFDDYGKLTADAGQIAARFDDTFQEKSQSGHGLHIYARGKIARQVKQKGLEIYKASHFVYVTGDAMNTHGIIEKQKELDEIFDKYVKETVKADTQQKTRTANHSDGIITALQSKGSVNADTVITRARHSKAAAMFEKLFDAGQWRGDYPSQSEADARLMGLLYWVSCGDDAATVAAFMRSKLAENVNRKRKPDDYVMRTLNSVKRSTDTSKARQRQQKQLLQDIRVKMDLTI